MAPKWVAMQNGASIACAIAQHATSGASCRSTVGTEMARLGVPSHVRSLVLNHSPRSRGVTDAVYNRYAYDKEKLEALTIWEKELAKLIAAR